MPGDLHTLTVTPKWDGDRLMLGRIVVGEVQKRPDMWPWGVHDGSHRWEIASLRRDARSALVEAVVRAIGGESE